MQGTNNNEFDDLKSINEMGFSSVVQLLNIINDNNEKSQKIFSSILDKLDALTDNIGTISTSIGRIGIGSFVNYDKLSYKVQLDIHKTILSLTKLQQKFLETITGKNHKALDLYSPETTQKQISEKENQSASFGGKIINANNIYELNFFKDTKKETIENSIKFMKELNKFMNIRDQKFNLVVNFFRDTNSQLQLITKILKPAALGFAMLAGSIMLLQFASFINVLKLAMVFPILGIGIGLFISAIISATRKIGGGLKGLFKFYMIMKALPELFLNLGKGILLLSVGLVLFNLVGYESILKLITTMISLGIAFKLMAGGDDSWTSTAKLFIVIGIILATTNALLQTQNIKWDSVLKLPAFIGALGIALHIGGFDKFEKIKVMNMLSISLLLLTLSLLEFKYITWENIIKYNVFIAGLGLSLRTIKKDIPMLSLLAMGFVVLGLALLDFQELNWMSMIQIIGVVGLLGVVINKFVLGKLGSSKSYNNMSDSLSGGGFKGGGLIGFALGLFLLTFAIQRFSGISWKSVGKAILMMAALGLVFKVFFQEKTSSFLGMSGKSSVQVPPMIGFALGMGLLVLALDAVSEIEWKSVFQLIALMTAIGLIFKFLMPQKSKSTGMLGFALGMGLLVLVLDALTEIQWESVGKLVVLMLGIGFAMKLMSGTGILTLLGLSAAIGVLSYSLIQLQKAKLSTEVVVGSLLFLSGIASILFFIGAPMFYKNVLIGAGITALIGVATYTLAKALQQVSQIKFSLEGTLTFLGGVVILGLVFTAIGLLITGPQAVLFGVGAGAVLVIAGVTYIMAHALSAISQLNYSEKSFIQFSYGIQKVINAWINIDPIATVASVVTAGAALPILLISLVAIGILKLIDLTFDNGSSLGIKIPMFTKSLGDLITGFNDQISMWKAGKAALKSVAILPILGTMYLAALVLGKISNTNLDAVKLGTFNAMLGLFVSSTVNTINKHKDALVNAQPGIKSILSLINVANSLAQTVQNIANLRFTELGIKDGKIVTTGFRKLGPADFENVGKSISKLLMALIKPIIAIGMNNDTWRIGSDSIQNPFKNNTFLNGIDNIKKINDAFKPFVDSIVNFTKTGVTTSKQNTDNFYYGVTQTAKSYGYVFWKLSQIKKLNLLKDAFVTIDAIKNYNELWEDLDYDTFKDYSNLFISFIDRLSDASKWKQIHTNIRILTANMQKMVKSINSIDLQKAAALEVNVKQLSDRSNINYIKQVIEEFVNLFGVITQAQYNNQVMFANTMGSFGQTLQQTQTVPGMVQNQKNQENQKELNKIKSGETSIVIDNFKDKNQQNVASEFDTNNDGVINSSDNLDNIGNKLDKLIAIMMAYNSPFSRK